MLQLQNVVKKYKTKAGEVGALNGVSLTFPTTGLVFITGKSGCGKTTLLNVIGGLDGIDSGEILIQDKKFSEFSAAEYDSYRNTFIGFIFQEYNILPEFTVEKNIKIAMELQGRKADEEEYEKLLKDVEIDALKNRKPSELSGGQRQRVAIARALVKQPRIIMADEPTGALDSGTGLQVLDTLKKLSKETLVIVVSHDREFAERYADRIIHLEDGRVVQDVTFTEKEIETNVSEQGDTFIVREGSDLSECEKNALAKAVKERKNIEIIEKPCFRDKAPTGVVEHNAERPVSMRKSKMKLRSSAHFGLKSLVVKPIRLIITIIISALAFAVFGVFDTIANVSTSKVLKNQLKIAPAKTVVTTTDYVVDYEAGDRYAVKLSQNAVEDLENKTGGKIKGIFDLTDNFAGTIQQSLAVTELSSSNVLTGKKYYSNSVNGLIEFEKDTEIAEDGKFRDFDYKLICGEYPELVYNEDGSVRYESVYKVAVSTYFADSAMHYLNGNPLQGDVIDEYEKLLGKTITVASCRYQIVGIIDCGTIPEKYAPLAQATLSSLGNNTLASDFNAYINASAQKCLFVAKDFLKAVKADEGAADIFYTGNVSWTLSEEGGKTKKQVATYVYNAADYNADNVVLFSGEYAQDGKITLADDEVLISVLNLEELFATKIAALPTNAEKSDVKQMIHAMQTNTVANNRAALKELIKELNVDLGGGVPTATIYQRFTKTGKTYEKQVKIVGAYFGVDLSSYTLSYRYKLMMNKNLMQEMSVFPEQGDYNKLLFSPRSVRSGGNAITGYLLSEDGLMMSWYNNTVLNDIRTNETVIRQAAKLFLYVDLALSLFAIFMLYNYMSTSISSKKRSVGILRALGSGGKDILITFLCESLIVAVINGILATGLAVLGCALVNAYIVQVMNISIHFALFGIRQVFLIWAVSLLTAIISSSLPIVKISKKKPVELIRRV